MLKQTNCKGIIWDNVKFGSNKKGRKNSRSFFGPTSTYEKQPFEKGIKLNSNVVPNIK